MEMTLVITAEPATAVILGWGLRDREGLRNLGLLIFRDISSLVTWLLAFTKRTTIWRGTSFILTRDGRLVAQETIANDELHVTN